MRISRGTATARAYQHKRNVSRGGGRGTPYLVVVHSSIVFVVQRSVGFHRPMNRYQNPEPVKAVELRKGHWSMYGDLASPISNVADYSYYSVLEGTMSASLLPESPGICAPTTLAMKTKPTISVGAHTTPRPTLIPILPRKSARRS